MKYLKKRNNYLSPVMAVVRICGNRKQKGQLVNDTAGTIGACHHAGPIATELW